MKKFFVLIFCGCSVACAATWAAGQNANRETPTGQVERSPAQIAYLKRAAGFNALRGPGAVITLSDRNAGDATAVVHDYDLLLVINQLMAAKAEAIAINGVRLGSHTGIRATGPMIVVGDEKLQPPFRIEAIGDGDWFAKILKTSGLEKSFREAGPRMTVDLSNDVRVAALEQAPNFRFAKPD